MLEMLLCHATEAREINETSFGNPVCSLSILACVSTYSWVIEVSSMALVKCAHSGKQFPFW